MRTHYPVLAGLLSLAAKSSADPTWPAPTDHMEEIVFQLNGFKGSLFSDLITPCNNEAAGPGRVTASEWLRIGFHDMATANRFFGTGGLDASVQFELRNGENTGPGHNTTLKFYSNYLTSRSSMADLIAAGVYASVRACGGPIISLKLGRRDATSAGSSGVPQPQNSVATFRQQFDRMGFSATEMIQVTACGHTLGGVHSEEFPDLVPPGTGVNGQIGLDTTEAVFDNKVVTEYLDGSTTNPLVVGPSRAINRHSDFKVFSSDGNVTMNGLTEPATFQSICRNVLQKMIDVVPAGVTLTEPIAPYMVKPVDMELTLNSAGTSLLLTGYIRIRTTELAATSIGNIRLTWKDRNGGNSCGSSSCSTTSTLQGVASGLDDTFGFFPISATIPAASGISSFTVTVNLEDGSSQTYDNNGEFYPMSDAIVLQKPQSCLSQSSGAMTVAALIHNSLPEGPVNLEVSYLVPRNTANGNPVPALNTATVPMTKGACAGAYTFYTADYSIPGGLSYNARFSVTAGSGTSAISDSFNRASDLTGTCQPFSGGATCNNGTVPSSSVVSSTASSTVVSSSSVVSSATSTVTSSTVSSTASSSVVSSSASSVPSSVVSSTAVSSTASSTVVSSSRTVTSSSTSGTPTPAIKEVVGGYRFVHCRTEGSGARALSGASFAYDGMTLESCMTNCTGFDYWGTEYGRECYCGNSLASSSSEAPHSECDMTCSGDPTEFCGGGNRLELYSTTATRSTSATPTPTDTLAVKPTVGAYVFVGCQTEGTGVRALGDDNYASDDMTLESCADYCSDYTYFGTEYSRECFCGDILGTGSTSAPLSDCSMTCAGNPFDYCGAGNRLQLYRLATASSIIQSEPPTSSSTPASSAAASTTTTPSPTGTLAVRPTVSPFTFAGCWTEGNGARALSAKGYESATQMTLESCADFCEGFKYFGTEYSSQCYCGNALHPTSENVSVSDCGMTCSGSPHDYCGGGNRLSLYENDDVIPPSGPSHPPVVNGEWSFYSCLTEGANGVRALGDRSTADDEMTLGTCAEFCEGYAYFGTEYGRECYCGDLIGNGATVAPETECSMACAGDGGEYCGAGNRLSVYSFGVDE